MSLTETLDPTAASAFLTAMEAAARQRPYRVEYALPTGTLEVEQAAAARIPQAVKHGLAFEFFNTWTFPDGTQRLLTRAEALDALQGGVVAREGGLDVFARIAKGAH